MNATQSRMARAALDWSLDDLARESGANRRSLVTFENDGQVLASTVEKVRQAFEREGVVFIGRGVFRGGVVPPVEGA
ncbi:helix-turn-helix domain-containing protein [Sphingomonas sp. KRR8]|uniref:helix-turn-helix domain-containing protein n=1 Tax=Sphingomonas sp. KRR8 TaxID=2942996 RepID=UPI002021EEBC|nr:helix-turn-helix domain-containing protein [Sphingomonas sp. KRR8]URD60475.1 helix-turn-helix domain-containing protein [Sphingomonas sp. KRR8]